MFNPLVSIIIPVYNGSNYVGEAIDSALAQTYQNIEVIVVNDGSNDDGATEKIALSYGDKIRYFQKENGGVSTALNLGIANMKGDYFSWLSHDDKYTPEKIKNQIELLSCFSERESLVALCGTRQIDKNSEYLSNGMKYDLTEKKPLENVVALKSLFRYGTFNGCALLIPKKAFEECGVFDEQLRYNQDSFMWIKIFLKGYQLVYQNENDALMRIHNGQLTQRGIEIYHRDCEYMSDFLIPELSSVSNKRNPLLYLYAKHNAKYNTPKVWKNCIKQEKNNITFVQKVKIFIVSIYGKIRPLIRKIYYKLFKKVNTK